MKKSVLLFLFAAKAKAWETVPGEFIVRKAEGKISALAFEDILPDGSGLVKGQSEEKLEKLKKDGAILDFEPNYVLRIVGGATPPGGTPPPWPAPKPPVGPVKPAPKPKPPAPPKPQPPAPQPPGAGPNDPMLSKLWGLTKIQASEAWKKSGGGSSSVTTVVIDTGIDAKHPDLAANMAGPGFNAITGAPSASDDHGHGTHCAGTIAGVGNNNVGVAGVAYKTRLLGAKFLAAQGGGSTSDAIKAIDWAIQQPGVRVLSNSWGGGGPSRALEASIKRACEKGVLFVVAAGNENNNNDTKPSYPTNYALPCVLSVAATDSADAFASFSNYGVNTVFVAAPGVNILSTFPQNKYQSLSGTSMATPHVAGLAALLFSLKPSLSAVDVKAIIEKTSDPLNSSRVIKALASKAVKFGRINAARAVAEAASR